MMNLKNIRKQISEFREELSAFIDTLPDGADGVNFLDKEKKCATVNFSTLVANKGIMSAQYYLNHTAKEEMRRVIKNTRLESLDSVIEKIIQTGNIPSSTGRQDTKINPAFIAMLQQKWLRGKVKEHDIVITTCEIKREKPPISENTKGTIAHIHKNGETYEVEFPENRVVTVKPMEITDVTKDD